MPHADVNGQRLFYEDTGDGDDVIVFSHGFFMNHSMFDPQVEALSDTWRCVAWDERGHGQTETTARPVHVLGLGVATCSACSTTSASSGRSSRGCRRAASCRCARR